jgi:hypothetical protein
MSITPGCLYSFVARQFLRQFEIAGRCKDDGNEVMTKIMYPDSGRINARFDGAALYRVPHIARLYLLDMIGGFLGMTDEQGSGFTGVFTGLQVVAQSIAGAVRELYNSLLIALANDNRLTFKQIHVTDTQGASLRDAQTAISQEEDKRPVPEFRKVVSYSIAVGEYLLNALPVEQDQALTRLESQPFIGLLKEGCLNTWVSIGGEKIQALYSRSVQGLRGRVHGRRAAEKLYVSLFREWGVNANSIGKVTQSKRVHGRGLFAVPVLYEVEKVIYGFLHRDNLSCSNAHYIRLEMETQL